MRRGDSHVERGCAGGSAGLRKGCTQVCHVDDVGGEAAVLEVRQGGLHLDNGSLGCVDVLRHDVNTLAYFIVPISMAKQVQGLVQGLKIVGHTGGKFLLGLLLEQELVLVPRGRVPLKQGLEGGGEGGAGGKASGPSQECGALVVGGGCPGGPWDGAVPGDRIEGPGVQRLACLAEVVAVMLVGLGKFPVVRESEACLLGERVMGGRVWEVAESLPAASRWAGHVELERDAKKRPDFMEGAKGLEGKAGLGGDGVRRGLRRAGRSRGQRHCASEDERPEDHGDPPREVAEVQGWGTPRDPCAGGGGAPGPGPGESGSVAGQGSSASREGVHDGGGRCAVAGGREEKGAGEELEVGPA